MQRRRLRAAVFCARANQDVVRIRLGVLNLDVEVAVLGEGVCVPNFKFAFHLRARAALRDQFFVGKTRLRIAINRPHETVRGRAVDVPIELLHVLAVITFGAAHAEEPFFQKRIALVPKRERETKPPFVIGNSADAILIPAVSARPRLIVRKIIPGVAVCAVIFADRAPGALGQIWPPKMPWLVVRPVFSETLLLCIHHRAITNRKSKIGNLKLRHSHSIVLGGLLEMSKQTRLTPLTSLLMRDEMRASSS